MFRRGQIRLKHEPHPHGIPALWRDVHGGSERVLELQAVRLDRDDLQDR